jgi:hypothetical protein
VSPIHDTGAPKRGPNFLWVFLKSLSFETGKSVISHKYSQDVYLCFVGKVGLAGFDVGTGGQAMFCMLTNQCDDSGRHPKVAVRLERTAGLLTSDEGTL